MDSSNTVLDMYKVEHEFSVSINLRANELTSNTTTLLRKLNELYLNKCYNGKFITNINKIIKKTNITVKSGKGYIDIMFEAMVLQISPGDLIPYVTICNINSTHQCILGSIDNVQAIIPIENKLGHINVGHKLPITVDQIIYQRNTSVIGIRGSLLRLPNVYYYKLKTSAKDVDIQLFKKMSASVLNASKTFDQFLMTIYDNKNKEFNDNIEKYIIKKIDFNEFTNLEADDIVFCPNNKSKFDCCYKLKSNVSELDNVNIVEIEPVELFNKICRSYTILSEVYKEIEENVGVVDFLKKCYQ